MSQIRHYKTLPYLAVALAMLLLVALSACGGTTQTTQAPATSQVEQSTTTEAQTSTTGAPVKTVTLTAVSFLDKTHPLTTVIPIWIDLVKQKTGGSVIIDWKGGPEVIAAPDQLEAARTGAVDLAIYCGTYYERLAPAVKCMGISKLEPWEERTNGLFEYLAKIHREQLGVEYVGRWLGHVPFYIWVNKPIKTLDDLKGMNLRSTAVYEALYKALGISGTTVDAAEVYTALERNIVQGFSFTLLGPRTSGWATKCKYYIDAPFWGANNSGFLFNPKSWSEKLSDEQRKQVMEATEEFEHQMVAKFDEMHKAEKEELAKIGVQPIELSPEDKAKFDSRSTQVVLDYLKEKVPDQLDTIKKLTGNS